jgi:hypothetical protein
MSTIVLQILWEKTKNPENVAALPLPNVQDGLANLVLEALIQHPKADTNLSPTTSSYWAASAIFLYTFLIRIFSHSKGPLLIDKKCSNSKGLKDHTRTEMCRKASAPIRNYHRQNNFRTKGGATQLLQIKIMEFLDFSTKR